MAKIRSYVLDAYIHVKLFIMSGHMVVGGGGVVAVQHFDVVFCPTYSLLRH